MASDQELRHHVYATTVELGRPPLAHEAAEALGMSEGEVLEGFARLRSLRLLFLARDTDEIVMAPPFSAAPTSFVVDANGKSYYANCVWDAYGIAAALHAAAAIRASCACCGEPMTLEIRDGRPSEVQGIAHFAVPAADWWNDLPYT